MNAQTDLRWVVEAADEGTRLDRFLQERLPNKSRSALQRAIDLGRVALDGHAATKTGHALKVGQVITVEPWPEALAAGRALAEDIALPIIYQDEHLVVVDKPAGLVVHPAPGHRTGTLVNALLHWADEEDVTFESEDIERPGIVHRIDKDTSGLLVVAVSEIAMRGLQQQFQAHTVERVYRAVVHGPKLAETGTISTTYGRDPKDRKRFTGRLKDSTPEEPDARTLLRTSKLKHAVTHWRVVLRGAAFVLIECRLETGRTHQIRVHLSEANHAIVGDPIYGHALPRSLPGVGPAGQRELIAARTMPRLALHAAVLGFVHPVTGAYMRFEAPDPPDFAALVDAVSVVALRKA